MTDTQRQQIRDRIIAWTDWVIANGYAVWGSIYYEPGNNYACGHLVGMTSAGYAIFSENQTKGQSYINISTETINSMLNFVNTRLSGGDANEGWSYGSGYALNLFYTFAIVKTASSAHTDYFKQCTWDEQVIQFLIYATLPDRKHLLPNGDWARESTGLIWDQHRSVADLISTYCDVETSRRIAAYWGPETYPVNNFHNFYVWRPFIFFDNEITPLDYKTVAPFNNRYYIFTDSSGTGQFLQRTDWSESANWVSFRAGGMYGDHAHNGNGHTEIWENGWLVADDNIFSRDGTEIPDWAHNMVQLEPMSETWNIPANDYAHAEHAAIPRREFTSSYSYIWENSTNIYQKQKNNTATKAERQFIYFPGKKLIVTYDIAATQSASNYKKNRWHFGDTPQVNGSVISYSNGTSKVYCHAAFPANPQISVDTRTVDIQYPTDQQKNYFITVLYTRGASANGYTVTGISRDQSKVTQSDLYGASVAMSGESYNIVFLGDDNSFSYDVMEYTVPLGGSAKNYLAGLDESTTYYVKMTPSGSDLDILVSKSQLQDAITVTSSENGILYFTYSETSAPQPPQNLRIH